MPHLAHVVQQLRKERNQAQRRVEQLDEALKALTGSARHAELSQNTAVVTRWAENEGPCSPRLANELQPPCGRVAPSGKRHSRANKQIMCGHSRLTATTDWQSEGIFWSAPCQFASVLSHFREFRDGQRDSSLGLN
jgi:hypothetical protein